ncbi:NAD(P)/FAD-dependent oxidoreductase [Jiella sp. MQZ9-1]|nr:NAD(P)/FAD-dependent oxidoreductase [Jiella flava]MCD2472797.1 NAD(P)/FAD-dependent oxidoreductase [Jiella flava]
MPDVVILGAGQSGLAAGWGLKRHGVTNVVLLDASPAGCEGVWETYARNYEIRSPKETTGIEGGIPSLSIEAYTVARLGQPAWDAMGGVPRTIWMDYLRWFRSFAGLEIRNDTRVERIDYDADGVSLSLAGGGTMRARLLVLATGMEGGGAWVTPGIVSENLPRHVWNHSADVFDERHLSGKRVAVLGAGAAAFDMAVTALDAGAERVDMLIRRPELPLRDVLRWFETGGFLVHAARIPPEVKWQISSYVGGLRQAPAAHHFHRACTFENFKIHVGSGIEALSWTGSEIALRTPRRLWGFDHLFAATGVGVNMALRPELSRLREEAALWRDRFTPPAGEERSPKLDFPWLDDYAFTERTPGSAPGIDRVLAFNQLSAMSMGSFASVSIAAFLHGTPRLVQAVTRRLFDEQIDKIMPQLEALTAPGVVVPDAMARWLAEEERAVAEMCLAGE